MKILDGEDDKGSLGRYWKRVSDFEQLVRVPILNEGRIDIPSMDGRTNEGVYFDIRHSKYKTTSSGAKVVSIFLVNGNKPQDTKTTG